MIGAQGVDAITARADLRLERGLRRVSTYSEDERLIADLADALRDRDERIAALQAQLDAVRDLMRPERVEEFGLNPQRRIIVPEPAIPVINYLAERSRAVIEALASAPSDVLDRVKREAAEKAWDEGVNAKANSSSIFTADVLARNPYREATA